MNRRTFLTSAAFVGARSLRAAKERPNVVFIISDQIHHRAMGAAGNATIQTPNLDRLAREGVRFENAVCVTPFCSPSRASFLTGVYPHTHGVKRNLDGGSEALDLHRPTTEQALYDAGYRCRQFGKWHLGDRSRVPAYRDQPEGSYKDAEDRAKGKYSEARGRNGRPVFMTPEVQEANRKGKGQNTIIGRIDLPGEKTRESHITDDALAELDGLAGGGQPFFLTVSLPAPHAPWEVGEPYYSMHPRSRITLPANRSTIHPADRSTNAYRFGQLLGDEGMREYLGVYYGLVSMMDWNVGRILDALGRRGLESNTLVIFAADHGDMQGGHGCYDKTTFSMYEETTRIPMLMRLPGRAAAGKVVRTQAGSCDISPTILDYVGIERPAAIHGTSLRAYIEGHEDLKRPMFTERDRGAESFQRSIRTLEWKYAYASSGASQLYNLAEDPGETRNLIEDAKAQTMRTELHSRLVRWMRETGDSRKIG